MSSTDCGFIQYSLKLGTGAVADHLRKVVHVNVFGYLFVREIVFNDIIGIFSGRALNLNFSVKTT